MFGKPARPPAPPRPPDAKASQAAATLAPAHAPSAASQTESAPVAHDIPSNSVRKTPIAASLIAENMTLEGSISADGELHVDGAIKGQVRVSRLTIGDSGRIEGEITAESVEVRGKIIGSVTAKQIRLAASAHVDGDITHEQLAIEAGAFFQGRSLKFQRQPNPATAAILSPKPTEKPADKPAEQPAAAAG